MAQAAPLLIALSCWTALAIAAPIEPEIVSFDVRGPVERGSKVNARLRIPPNVAGRVPAVIILTSSPGFDGRSAFYAEALNDAGIATFEADVTAGRGLPASPRDHLPHVFQSHEWLAAHPRIDGSRVGVMGMSWGGILALLSSSEELRRDHGVAGLRFAAHLALYPICWLHASIVEEKPTRWKDLTASAYRSMTGRPIHLMVGDKDGYDRPGDCARFVAALPEDARRNFRLTVYPEATFAWDARFDSTTWEAGGDNGRGAFVKTVANADVAAQSRRFAVEFFQRHLKVD